MIVFVQLWVRFLINYMVVLIQKIKINLYHYYLNTIIFLKVVVYTGKIGEKCNFKEIDTENVYLTHQV